MRKLVLSLSAILALSVATLSAHADTYTYTFTGGLNGSFSVDSSSALYTIAPGALFCVPVTGTTGDFAETPYVDFFNAFYVLPINLESFGVEGQVTSGPQLYTGPESSPTYLAGTFDLTNFFGGGGPITLDVVNTTTAIPPAATTPEPSSLVLLGTGLLGSIGALRRRLTA